MSDFADDGLFPNQRFGWRVLDDGTLVCYSQDGTEAFRVAPDGTVTGGSTPAVRSILASMLGSESAPNGYVATADGGGGVAYAPSGGGPQPGSVYCEDFLFTEPAAPHADLVATFAVPAGATVLDMWLYPFVGPWADIGSHFGAGDSNRADAYFTPADVLLGVLTSYDPEAVVAGANFVNVNQDSEWYASAPPFSGNSTGKGGGIPYPAGDTITMTASGIVTGGGGGVLLARLWVKSASTPTPAT